MSSRGQRRAVSIGAEVRGHCGTVALPSGNDVRRLGKSEGDGADSSAFCDLHNGPPPPTPSPTLTFPEEEEEEEERRQFTRTVPGSQKR